MNTVKRGVFTGAAAFGFLKAWRQNFKANRARRRKRKGKELTPEQERLISELGETEVSMAANTGLRSSSNMVIAGGLTNIIIEVVQMFAPEFQLSAEVRTYLTLGIAWIASRFTKTPEQPKIV